MEENKQNLPIYKFRRRLKPNAKLKIVTKQFSICAICTNVKKLTVHHIVPLTKGGNHNNSNLIGLCRECHDIVDLDPVGYAPQLIAYKKSTIKPATVSRKQRPAKSKAEKIKPLKEYEKFI